MGVFTRVALVEEMGLFEEMEMKKAADL